LNAVVDHLVEHCQRSDFNSMMTPSVPAFTDVVFAIRSRDADLRQDGIHYALAARPEEARFNAISREYREKTRCQL
jgi:hypothetical protein